MWELLWLLAQRRVALVHVHSAAYGSFWRKSVLCGLTCLFRVPYIFHLHDGRFPVFYQRGCNTLAQAWVRTILRNSARVVVLTQRWRDEVRKIVPTARTTVIANSVAIPIRLLPLRHPAQTVLFLGWLQKEKGVLDLVRAIAPVLRSVPEAVFVFAGTGDVDSLSDLARSLGVEQAVRFPGWVDGARKDKLLREVDVFVLPSYYEGLPIGVLESMACGVPVVATAVGGIPDAIQDGVNGLLVEPGQPEALARAIVAILSDDALRTRLRELAHRDARKRYSADIVVGDLERMYRELGIRVESIKREASSSAS